jgi:hypothetical protein
MMRGWAGLFPEEVGVHVGITMCKKSPAEATVVMAADKCQEVVALRHAILAVAGFVRLFGCIGESCFFKRKKGAKQYKSLKDC